jgi:hypothetical protein
MSEPNWLRTRRLVNSSLGGASVMKKFGMPTKAQKSFIRTIERELGLQFNGTTFEHATNFIKRWKPKLEEKQNDKPKN